MSLAASRWTHEVQAYGTIKAGVSATSAGEHADSAIRRPNVRDVAVFEAISNIGVRPW